MKGDKGDNIMWISAKNGFQVGDRVELTQNISAMSGTMLKGTIVTITDVSNRGYDIKDDEGHQLIECGFDGFKAVSQDRIDEDKLAEDYLNQLGFPYTTSADEQLPSYYEQAKGWIDNMNIDVDKDIYAIISKFAKRDEEARLEAEAEMRKEQEMDR